MCNCSKNLAIDIPLSESRAFIRSPCSYNNNIYRCVPVPFGGAGPLYCNNLSPVWPSIFTVTQCNKFPPTAPGSCIINVYNVPGFARYSTLGSNRVPNGVRNAPFFISELLYNTFIIYNNILYYTGIMLGANCHSFLVSSLISGFPV